MSISEMPEGPKQAVCTAVHLIRQRLLKQMASSKDPILIDHYRQRHEQYDFNKLASMDIDDIPADQMEVITKHLNEAAFMFKIASDQLLRSRTSRANTAKSTVTA